MDKKMLAFSEGNITITVLNGRIINCCLKEREVTLLSKDFYEVLEEAMTRMSTKNPRIFVDVLKLLKFRSREFKMAKSILLSNEALKAILKEDLGVKQLFEYSNLHISKESG